MPKLRFLSIIFLVLLCSVLSGGCVLEVEKSTTEKRVAYETETPIEKQELKGRLDKAIPHKLGSEMGGNGDFNLLGVSSLDKSGAVVDLYDTQTKMVCTGNVSFINNPTGGQLDELVVSKCYSSSQPTRIYMAGVLMKDKRFSMY